MRPKSPRLTRSLRSQPVAAVCTVQWATWPGPVRQSPSGGKSDQCLGTWSLAWELSSESTYFPLARLSVDGCDLVTGSSSGSSNKNDQVSEDPHKEPQTKISKELTKEPRRRSVSASYSQSLISNNNNNIHNCNLCQISVNSQSQLAQVNIYLTAENLLNFTYNSAHELQQAPPAQRGFAVTYG